MPVKKKRAAKSAGKKKVVKKKAIKKRPVKKAAGAKKRVVKKPGIPKEEVVGTVTHYFPKVNAAVIRLKAPLSVGESVKIKGHTTDFIQNINSMQIDHVSVDQAKKGQEVGLLVNSRVRQHDLAYRVK